ncbi:MAG: hypothetical protein BWY20_02430 [Spirochaetes bacterium ADurb.Bin215]|nr:MAG: hypothetical protein BWY20_02430 [Spirochaetes bacterium ADurb.Bin215]
MAKTKTGKNPYLFTVDELAEFAEVTPRWIYQLVQNRRLWRNANGLIDCGAYANIGILVTMVKGRKLAELTDYVRARYHLGPAPGLNRWTGYRIR